MRISVIFGAGKYSIKARQYLETRKSDWDKLLYCDNYKSGEIDGIAIISYKELQMIYLEHVVSIIIATAKFQEIYEQCVLDQLEIEGIYDVESDSVKGYYDYCLENCTGYTNHGFIKYIYEMERRTQNSVEKFFGGEELGRCITEVAIMISNLCNYACIHNKCPASKIKQKEIMSVEKFQSIILELKAMQFKGTVAYHIYNDPMIDPRLFAFVKYVREQMPDVKSLIYTNGYYLNQEMINDLERLPIDVLIVTGYGKKEYERLLRLDVHIPFRIYYGNLDDRLENYSSGEKQVDKRICRTFITELPIYTNGDIGLCCLDYKHEYGLGNVFESGLEKCINSGKMRKLQEELLNGDRSAYGLCSRCSWKL